MTNIGVDMMGGDFAPVEAARGIFDYFNCPDSDCNLTLLGDENAIRVELAKYSIPDEKISIIHTSQIIEMQEHPTRALKEKTDSSIAVGFHQLANNNIDAFISAGNTGAMMVGSLFSIKTIDGVIRPTIGAYIPREDGRLGLLLDVGLNSDCKPENLNQFAILGSLFAEKVLRISNPRVSLINLGEEEGKGNILAQATYPLLKENKQIHFVGNIEGRDILIDKSDVMVCDGFTGNVLLKFAESFYDLVKRRKINDEHLNRFNFESYGGVPVLGVSKPVVIGHGISGSKSFCNMIITAKRMVEADLSNMIKTCFAS